jgi:hypothetical protein
MEEKLDSYTVYDIRKGVLHSPNRIRYKEGRHALYFLAAFCDDEGQVREMRFDGVSDTLQPKKLMGFRAKNRRYREETVQELWGVILDDQKDDTLPGHPDNALLLTFRSAYDEHDKCSKMLVMQETDDEIIGRHSRCDYYTLNPRAVTVLYCGLNPATQETSQGLATDWRKASIGIVSITDLVKKYGLDSRLLTEIARGDTTEKLSDAIGNFMVEISCTAAAKNDPAKALIGGYFNTEHGRAHVIVL